MPLPRQIDNVTNEREAYAPYNFVPLPERVVAAETVPAQDSYHPERFHGRIVCTLTSASPLYVRSGYSPEAFAAYGHKAFHELTPAEQAQRARFFHYGGDTPVIPGSSLRGMLRALVEIVGYGKMDRVTDRPRFFYRAVAVRQDDPLASPYRSQLRNVKAGYLNQSIDGAWQITPARRLNSNESFIKIREQDIPSSLGLVRISHPDYHLQRIRVSFTYRQTPRGRIEADRIAQPGVHTEHGTLVTSGNMIETGGGRRNTPRKNHVIILEPDRNAQNLRIAPQAAEDYVNGLSDFIVEQFGSKGILTNGAPVFYCEPTRGQDVTAFGHSPNFRLPYRFPESLRAATPRDFVPEYLRQDDLIDLAEAMFGFVRSKKASSKQLQAAAGRIFVGDAHCEPGQEEVWLSEEPITPQILSSPKPTTFQHYLVQTSAEKSVLKHYGTLPTQTNLRGHKLYWHKGNVDQATLEQADAPNELTTQQTRLRPVRAGVRFSFTIDIENLSAVELGALLWVLRLCDDEWQRTQRRGPYRLKLGMGKPLGMGALKLEYKLQLSDRTARYQKLFDDEQGWAEPQPAAADQATTAMSAFENYVLHASGEAATATDLHNTMRIKCLLTLLSWPGPEREFTRSMEIERDHQQGPRPGRNNNGKVNEYSERLVLPGPLQVHAPPAPPPPPAPPKQAIEVGVNITGNRSGELRLRNPELRRGVKVNLRLLQFAIPEGAKEVIGFIPWAHANGQISGGFRGIVRELVKDGTTLYLVLEKAPKAEPSQEA